MEFVNLTPHVINAVMSDGNTLSLPPSGTVARVATETREVAPGFFAVEYGEVTGLPNGYAEDQTIFVVSGMVRAAVPDRGDVVSPGELLRDAEGRPVGCRGFAVNPGFTLPQEEDPLEEFDRFATDLERKLTNR